MCSSDLTVVFGIRYDETAGLIKDVAVLNIRDATGSSQGFGIKIQSTSGAVTRVRIEESHLENFTRVGIFGNGLGVKVRIEDNVLIGPVTPNVWAPNGIQVSRGAIGRVRGNEVSEAISPNPGAGSGSGIILFCAGRSVVSENVFLASDLGVALVDNSKARVTDNEVRDSLFDAYSLQIIGSVYGPLGCPDFPSPTDRNRLEGNEAFNSARFGVVLASIDPFDPTPPSNNRILDNGIEGSAGDGIHVSGGSDNRFKYNVIENSGRFDAVDETTGSGTSGTANRWVDNECVTSSPGGLCGEDSVKRAPKSFDSGRMEFSAPTVVISPASPF